MFRSIKFLIPVAFAAMSMASALEVSDLSMDLTRSDADDNLTKDYEYAVMEDLMVRRTWKEDKRRVIKVDFDPKDDSLKSIIVQYKEPVSVKFASKDILEITKAPKITWRKLATNRADKYGINRARAAKVDNAYILLDTDNSDKCLYFILTPEKPDESPRTILLEVNAEHSNKTAMGSRFSSSGDVIKRLLLDEEKRFMQANKTDEDTDIVADTDPINTTSTTRITIRTTKKVKRKPAAATPQVAVTQPAPTVRKPRKDEEDISSPIHETTIGEEIEGGVSEFMEEKGLDKIPASHYAIGAGALIAIIIIIGALRRQAEAKKIAVRAKQLRRNSNDF